MSQVSTGAPAPEPDPPTSADYELLGVTPESSKEAVEGAYKNLARSNHPDKAVGDSARKAAATARFQEIQGAYARVLAAARRQRARPTEADVKDIHERVWNGQSPRTALFSGGANKRTRVIEPPPGVLPNGAQVLVKGLKSKVQFNDKVGRVSVYDDERYEVVFQGEERQRIKRENLVRLGITVTVGREQGQVVDYDENTRKYRVRIDGHTQSFDLADVCLPLGARVLQLADGRQARILRLSGDKHYVVLLQTGNAEVTVSRSDVRV